MLLGVKNVKKCSMIPQQLSIKEYLDAFMHFITTVLGLRFQNVLFVFISMFLCYFGTDPKYCYLCTSKMYVNSSK